MGQRLLKSSEIRYFHDNTYELDYAWLIATSLSQQKCVEIRPTLIKGYEDSKLIRKGHFELWLTRESLANYGCVFDYVAR